MTSSHLSLPFVAGTFFAAGLVKGVLGMGLPTFAMGVLGLLMPVPQAAGLITLPSLFTNIWQALTGGALRSLLARLWPLQVGILVGTAAAAWLPHHDDRVGRALLGACLLAYGASGLAGWRPRTHARALRGWLAPLAGASTGVLTALTGVFVLPAVPYLQSLQFDRHELPQAMGLSFTTSTIALGAFLMLRGDFGVASSMHSALAIAPALAGMAAGQKLRAAMSESSFRRCFFAGLVLLGAWLVLG